MSHQPIEAVSDAEDSAWCVTAVTSGDNASDSETCSSSGSEDVDPEEFISYQSGKPLTNCAVDTMFPGVPQPNGKDLLASSHQYARIDCTKPGKTTKSYRAILANGAYHVLTQSADDKRAVKHLASQTNLNTRALFSVANAANSLLHIDGKPLAHKIPDAAAAIFVEDDSSKCPNIDGTKVLLYFSSALAAHILETSAKVDGTASPAKKRKPEGASHSKHAKKLKPVEPESVEPESVEPAFYAFDPSNALAVAALEGCEVNPAYPGLAQTGPHPTLYTHNVQYAVVAHGDGVFRAIRHNSSYYVILTAAYDKLAIGHFMGKGAAAFYSKKHAKGARAYNKIKKMPTDWKNNVEDIFVADPEDKSVPAGATPPIYMSTSLIADILKPVPVALAKVVDDIMPPIAADPPKERVLTAHGKEALNALAVLFPSQFAGVFE
jgi:hypothetical protein